MADPSNNPRYAILLKEIDLLHSSIKNLDDIIFKTKNFAVVVWGGSLYLIAGHALKAPGEKVLMEHESLLIYFTAVIPIIFWAIHYRWQKHLSMCSARERMISWFINSTGFPLWLEGGEDVHFPVYDIPGWLYTKQADRTNWERLGVEVDEAYLLDHSDLGFWQVLLYKDAKWYYSLMIVISVLFGILR